MKQLNKLEQNPDTNSRWFEVIMPFHQVLYPSLGINRRTDRGLVHIPQFIRHQGMDFIAVVFYMHIARIVLSSTLNIDKKSASTAGGIGALILITANEIGQGLGHELIKQPWISGFDYKDIIAAALGFTYYKFLEAKLDK